MARNSDKWGLYDPRAPGNVSPLSYYKGDDEWILANGSYGWSYTGQDLAHWSRRDQYANSPIYTIPGTSTTFRKATPYDRFVYNKTTFQKLHYLRCNTSGVPNGDQRKTVLGGGYNPSESRIGSAWRFFSEARSTQEWDYPDFKNCADRSVTECLIKLGDNKVDIGTALAEAGKTVSHLATTAVDVGKAYSALRGKRWKEMFNILSKRSPLHSRKIVVGKTAAQYWLEYNYAWKPLFYEVNGLIELLKVQLEPAMLVHANRTVHGKAKAQYGFTPRGSGTGIWYGIHDSMSGSVKFQVTTRLTGQINTAGMRMAAMGFTNPAAIAWELVPYSFVVDWMIPVGNVLEAATATRGLTFVGGSQTKRYQSRANVIFLGKDYHIHLREGLAEVNKFRMQRTVYTAFPKPVLYSKSPFSTSHIISAVALLRQLL